MVSPLPDPVWERESSRRIGFVTSTAKYLTPVRWLLQANKLAHARVTPNVPVALGALISMVVAMDNSCRSCYGAFRSTLKITGYSKQVMRELEASLAVDNLTKKERAALEFAHKV